MIGLWAAAILAGSAPGQDAAPPRRPVVTHFAWRHEPRARLPREARDAGVREGLVRMGCDFDPAGVPTGCTIVSESHEGVGLGREALAAARRGRLAESALRDMPADAQYQFSLVLR